MKVDSFRELLIKKARGDANLQAFVKYVKDELIVDHTLEVLEKMARSSHKGDTANLPLRDFATEMDPEVEPHMIREALGHHVSQYKAALKGGNQPLANRHAGQAFKIMNMADRAQKHSGGKLNIEHVSPHAWERNKFKNQYTKDHPKVQEGKYKEGDFTVKTKGLNYGGSDFGFLQEAPHPAYVKEIRKHGHNKAYPFEQIRVNGKYIPINEKADVSGGYQEHPFDAHPILGAFSDPSHNRDEEADKRYFAERDKYYNESPHIENFFNQHQQLEQANPEEYAQRGSKPGSPVHADVEPLDITKEWGQAPQAAAPKAAPAQAAPAAEQPLDDAARKQALDSMHPETRKFIESLKDPALMDAVIKKHIAGGNK